MSTVPATPKPRHALGLPAGSIRALLAFGVLGYLWLLVLRPTEGGGSPLANQQASLAFIYLQFLMVLIIGHFFTAHGKTIGHHISEGSPLGLPSGCVRFLLLAGYLGQAVYLYYTRPKFELPETASVILLVLVLVSAYMVGYVITGAMNTVYSVLPPWFLDLQAWVALCALLLLGVILLIRLVINTAVSPDNQIRLDVVEAVLAGLVGLYFGARS